MVRCATCAGKYRIKSSHIARNLTTGPRTLDEMDPLLAGDSIDLDPDTDPAPVTIDDSGQVVGLSGLTELMRQTDEKQAKATVKARGKDAEPPPVARITRPATKRRPATEPPPASASPAPAATPPNSATQARERAQQRARQRKLQTNLILATGGLTLLVLIITLVTLFGGPGQPTVPTDPTGQNAATNPKPTPKPNNTPGPTEFFPEQNPDPQNPDTRDTNPQDPSPRDPQLFGPDNKYSANPDPQYVSAQARALESPPAEVPALLIEPEPLTHEGWYILTPPRGAIDATGPAGDIQLTSPTKAYTDPDGNTILTATLANRGEQAAIAGECHLALLDTAGRVFAETYLPFALLGPGESREIRIPVAQRFWDRARNTATDARVTLAANQLDPLRNVKLSPLGKGQAAAVRVSVRNPRDAWLGDAVLILTATDLDNHTLASFRVTQQDLLIAPGHWLDMVVHTPLPDTDSTLIKWSATLHIPASE